MKKKITLFLLFLIFSGFVIMSFEVLRLKVLTKEIYSDILNNKTIKIASNLENFQKKIKNLKKIYSFIDNLTGQKITKKFKLENDLYLTDNFLLRVSDLIAVNSEKTYYVLLQNNMELRPTGGFMGSYAKIKFKNGGMNKVTVQDIYVPDGQIEGHVDPPAPIQEAFKQGWFRLRDSNWDPDFPSSAQTINWFFQKGKEEKGDGMIAVNLNLMKDLLKIVGPIQLLNYPETVTEENLYQIAQSYSELNFYPGSTQKADIMTSLGNAFLEKIKNPEFDDLLKIIAVVKENLEEKQILLYSNDENFQKTFNFLNWDGSLKKISREGTISDYIFVVESNLGANKANCCIEREIFHQIDTASSGKLIESVIINFRNKSELYRTIKPVFWGGDYLNYLRVYFPIEAGAFKITVDGEVLSNEKIATEKIKDEIQSKGFFIKTKALSTSKVEINYEIPYKAIQGENVNYLLYIQKQPGIEEIPYFLSFKEKGTGCLGEGWEKNGEKCEQKFQIRKDKEINMIFEYN